MQQAAPAVGQAYTNAANADAGYAQGLGSVAQSALDQNQQQNNQFLQQMGTPAAALHPAAPVGQIEYGLQGYIPASTLQQEGAGWEAQAQLAPGNILNQGQQASQQTLLNDPTLVKLQGDLSKVAATEPDVYQKLLTGYEDQAYKNAELGLAGQRLQLASRVDAARLAQSQQRLNLDITKQQWDQQKFSQQFGLSYAKFQAEQRKANATQARLGNEATSRLYQEATKAAQGYYYGKAPKTIIGPTGQRQVVGGERQFTYQQTINALVNQFPGLGPQGAVQIADSLYRPGEGGRPHDSGTGGAAYFAQDAHGNAYMYEVPSGLAPHAQHQVSGILNLAKEYLGTPYVWGGESPKGFDCSGFAQYIYAKVGIEIPRTTYDQWTAPNGHPVAEANLEPGDLVYYKGSDAKMVNGHLLPGHVGVYVGGGMVVNAYGTGYGVRVQSVNDPSLGGYMGARRFVHLNSGPGPASRGYGRG